MNTIALCGRLTKEPEVRITPSEKTVCTFTLAVDRPFTDKNGKREADFINIVVWGKMAESSGNYLDKGSKCIIEGRLQIRNYVAKDGQKKYITEVIASHVEFLDKAKKAEEKTPMSKFGKTFSEDIPF